MSTLWSLGTLEWVWATRFWWGWDLFQLALLVSTESEDRDQRKSHKTTNPYSYSGFNSWRRVCFLCVTEYFLLGTASLTPTAHVISGAVHHDMFFFSWGWASPEHSIPLGTVIGQDWGWFPQRNQLEPCFKLWYRLGGLLGVGEGRKRECETKTEQDRDRWNLLPCKIIMEAHELDQWGERIVHVMG